MCAHTFQLQYRSSTKDYERTIPPIHAHQIHPICLPPEKEALYEAKPRALHYTSWP